MVCVSVCFSVRVRIVVWMVVVVSVGSVYRKVRNVRCLVCVFVFLFVWVRSVVWMVVVIRVEFV